MVDKTTEVYKLVTKEPKRINLLRGGARSSKSHSLLQMALKWLWTGKIGEHIYTWTDEFGVKHSSNQGIALIARQTFPALRRTLLREFINLARQEGMIRFIHYRKSYHEFIYQGRQISFLPLDETEKILGMQTVWFWINEGNNVPFPIFSQLLLRCEHMCFLDYNPFDPYGWINQQLELKRMVESDDVNLTVSTYKMNPFLPPQMVKEIEGTKDRNFNEWLVYSEGAWAQLPGLIFPDFEIIDTIPEYDSFTYGLDFGVTDPDVLVKVYKKDWNIYIQEIFYKANNSTSDLHYLLEDIEDVIYADSAHAREIKDLKQRGIMVRKAKKGSDSVVAGIRKIKSHKIHILSSSKNVINDFRKYKWEVDDEDQVVIGSNGMPKPVNKNKHSADAVAYALSRVTDFKASLINV